MVMTDCVSLSQEDVFVNGIMLVEDICSGLMVLDVLVLASIGNNEGLCEDMRDSDNSTSFVGVGLMVFMIGFLSLRMGIDTGVCLLFSNL